MLAVDDISILHIAVIIVASLIAGGAVHQLLGYAVGIPGGHVVGGITVITASEEMLQFSSHA